MAIPVSEATIRDAVQAHLGENTAFSYLLGTAGTDRFRADSDIDLAVFWKEPPSFEELNRIRNLLSDLFARDVDLVTLNGVDLIFSRQVLGTGRLLVCNSPGEHLQWQADQLSRYPDFKFSRAIVEENILKRKKYV